MGITEGRYADLQQLARLYNVQTSYYGVDHRRRAAPVESLLAVLRVLGAPVASFNDISAALRESRLALSRRLIEPVCALTDGLAPPIRVCLPGSLGEAAVECRLEMEDGEATSWKWRASDLPAIEGLDLERERFVVKGLRLPGHLPPGYHRLSLRAGDISGESLLISAPGKTYQPPAGEDDRRWGAFLPLYALKSEEGWGGADYPSFGRLATRLADLGGSVLGTLPLLPVFLDSSFEPSPYIPVSRRLWNEFYIDVTRAPGLESCPSALALLEEFRGEISRLKEAPLVDYPRMMAMKRRIMAEVCRCLPDSVAAELERFARENPVAEGYARFRAVMEKRQEPWPDWPQDLRDGSVMPGDFDEEARRYYLYAQWLAGRQLGEVAAVCREKGVSLYFDLPLGVHPWGYDIWRHRDAFALEASGGAPPDPFYTRGQDWGFPPLHPENIRRQGYRYVIDYMRHNLTYADMLRIDHMMGLHRLFWVPRGMDATHGVYVRYRAEELYAILALESSRHRCVIIGEDLGTVPPYVRPAMARHGVRRMFILQYALVDSSVKAPGRVPAGSLAALNNHDMPPFAAFWQDDDFAQRRSLSLLDEKSAAAERRARRKIKDALVKYLRRKGFLGEASLPGTRDVIRACLAYLGASPAGVVLVNLEDLWLETWPQNVPSIHADYPNWRRRARYRLEEMFQMKEITNILGEVDRLRKQEKR